MFFITFNNLNFDLYVFTFCLNMFYLLFDYFHLHLGTKSFLQIICLVVFTFFAFTFIFRTASAGINFGTSLPATLGWSHISPSAGQRGSSRFDREPIKTSEIPMKEIDYQQGMQI